MNKNIKEAADVLFNLYVNGENLSYSDFVLGLKGFYNKVKSESPWKKCSEEEPINWTTVDIITKSGRRITDVMYEPDIEDDKYIFVDDGINYIVGKYWKLPPELPKDFSDSTEENKSIEKILKNNKCYNENLERDLLRYFEKLRNSILENKGS